jgi:hypothetical protein
MTRLLASAVLLATLTAVASAKIERDVERTFTVQPGVHLRVATFGGNITVTSSNDAVVKVVAREHIRASNDLEADEALKKLELTIEQQGNEIVATASYPSRLGFHLGDWPPVEVEFEIAVPTDSSADLRTSGGDVVVDNLQGAVTAKTSGGDVKLGRIGADINAETSGGNMTLVAGLGSVHLTTSGGNITAKHILGTAELKTSGGDIKIDSVEGALSARTSGGDIKVAFDGALKGDSILSTSGGQVKASVGKGVGFHVDAATSGGEVEADGLTLTIDRGGVGKSNLSGAVNGGGPDLRLRSSGGDIEITTH